MEGLLNLGNYQSALMNEDMIEAKAGSASLKCFQYEWI